jgi:hypothetical protein
MSDSELSWIEFDSDSDYDKIEAGPSKVKRKQGDENENASKKRMKLAEEADVNLHMVCSNPRKEYLRGCIRRIRTQFGEKLPSRGNVVDLQNRILDYFQVPLVERRSKMLSEQNNNNDVNAKNGGYVYQRSRKYVKDSRDTSSVRSFENCFCERCLGKPWRKSTVISGDDGNNVIEDTTFTLTFQKIPSIKSIGEAIRQGTNGLLDKIYKKYRNTESWQDIRKLYSERMVCMSFYNFDI